MENQTADIYYHFTLVPFEMILEMWLASLIIMLVVGKPLINWLKYRKGMKWAPREDTPDTHLQKAGVPSMGGIGIIGCAALTMLVPAIFGAGSERPNPISIAEIVLFTLFPVTVVLHAVLGYLDDHSKATNKGGLSSRAKLLGQIVLAALFLGVLSVVSLDSAAPQSRYHAYQSAVQLVEFKSALFSSWPLILGAFLLIIGTSNAVNLTDGIDGLAAGLSVQVAVVFSVLWLESFANWTSAASSSAQLFWMALGGACLGFLAFNKHPARVFMGDTGSLALGAALGAGAILTRTVSLLPFIGFIFYVEMFSVILQVLYFKYTRRKTGEGKRLFRRAPLHHHFELGGWSEWRVVATFWAVNLVTSLIGLALWKMDVLPRFP